MRSKKITVKAIIGIEVEVEQVDLLFHPDAALTLAIRNKKFAFDEGYVPDAIVESLKHQGIISKKVDKVTFKP